MNALFKYLYDSVVVNTNRPNLVVETKNAIVAATRELHNRGKFKADVREVVLTSTNGGQGRYKFTIPVEKGIREIVNLAPATPNGCKGISIDSVDPFVAPVCGNWYSWLNNVLTIQVAHPATSFALTYLSFPKVTEAEYESWIARIYPHYVTDLATSRVLFLAGQSQQATFYKSLVGEARIPGTHIFNLLQEAEEIE